jgi:hypothetical protein
MEFCFVFCQSPQKRPQFQFSYNRLVDQIERRFGRQKEKALAAAGVCLKRADLPE